MKDYIKDAIIGISSIFVYYLLSKLQFVGFILLDIDISSVPLSIRILYAIVYEILLLSIIIMINNKKIVKDFLDIKKNHKKYYSECFKYWLIGLGIMLISNFIITLLLNKGISANEEAVRSIFKVSPIYIYFSGVIIAPIMEEIIYRMSIKNIITNKYLFVVVAGLLFGYAHLEGNIKNVSDLLYLIPYSSLGIAFAYMYEKSKNIFTSVGFHFMHNGLLLGLQFLILILQ